MPDLWARVKEALRQGKVPVVTIHEDMEILERGVRAKVPIDEDVLPRRRTMGWAMVTPKGLPMMCRAKGCRKKLSRHTKSICCSKRCEEQLRHYCETMLAILDGEVPAEDLPPYYRTSYL